MRNPEGGNTGRTQAEERRRWETRGENPKEEPKGGKPRREFRNGDATAGIQTQNQEGKHREEGTQGMEPRGEGRDHSRVDLGVGNPGGEPAVGNTGKDQGREPSGGTQGGECNGRTQARDQKGEPGVEARGESQRGPERGGPDVGEPGGKPGE